MSIADNPIAKMLRDVQILRNLDDEIILDIAQHIKTTGFQAEQVIVEKGHIGERIFFIFEGTVEVRIPQERDQEGRRILLRKGEVVGEISLLINSTYSADIVALTSTRAFYLDKPRFEELVETHPDFAELMTQLMISRMAQNGGINRVGKYELRGKLGEGNMATVFNAWDPELEREVAIKMLKYKLSYDEKFVKRFEREAKTIASLSHPNIVNVYEVIEAFSTRFIVMEKLRGRDLSAMLDTKGAFSVAETRDILSQIASALQYAHSHGKNGIVHRDIKPSNIVIDDYGMIKLTDFGIASPPQDKDVNIEGTPSYLAPEIINGDLLDGRADIYALGAMAFHMLTKSPPFSASTLAKLLMMQVQQKPPDIRNNVPDIDDAFADFIESALSKDPNDRIADWERIRKILLPLAGKFELPLDPHELAVIVRFRDTPYQQSASFINSMHKMLQEQGINHLIEMQRGRSDDDS